MRSTCMGDQCHYLAYPNLKSSWMSKWWLFDRLDRIKCKIIFTADQQGHIDGTVVLYVYFQDPWPHELNIRKFFKEYLWDLHMTPYVYSYI